jgi:tetratricopeptide (TPR) repeat protein
MAIVTTDNADLRGKLAGGEAGPSVVLASSDGKEIARVKAAQGRLEAADVEAMLRAEIDQRKKAVQQSLDAAKEKSSANDAEGAEALYRQVWEQRCLFPEPARKAVKALKKMGRPIQDDETSTLDVREPSFTDSVQTEIVRTMKAGLAAERQDHVLEAKRLYERAVAIDPGDPVPVRFLAELERHHTGDWARARTLFEQVLAMRPDPISKAVALHGLGKMTIHDGRFALGVSLFEESIRVYPLALTYRNLAVYWNSERNGEKAQEYVRKAIELDPDDTFNQIFAATYLVELGRPAEAEEIARRHEAALAASYNLAVIHAQLGNREKALSLLRRHFYAYEQFDAVRAKEMQEARDDIAFLSLHEDADFVKLTALAETDNMSFRRRAS